MTKSHPTIEYIHL